MREFVFDTKGSKKIKKFIPAFIIFTLLYAGIASLLVLGTGEVTTAKVVGFIICILVVLAIFGSMVLGVGTTNTKIKISHKGVDVKKSKNEGHYALEDYVEARIIEKKSYRGTVTRIPTLVFEVDEEEYLIDCTGFSTADAPKPFEYTVMKRPEKTILNDDEYSRLYNSIRKMCEVQGIKFDPYGTDF